MTKEQPPATKPDTIGAAQEKAARVPDNPTLANEAEFEVWATAFTHQERTDMLAHLRSAPSAVLGIK